MSDLLKWSQSTVADVEGGSVGRGGRYYSNTGREERRRKHADALVETLSRSTGCRRLNVVVRRTHAGTHTHTRTQSHAQTKKEKYSAESQSRTKKKNSPWKAAERLPRRTSSPEALFFSFLSLFVSLFATPVFSPSLLPSCSSSRTHMPRRSCWRWCVCVSVGEVKPRTCHFCCSAGRRLLLVPRSSRFSFLSASERGEEEEEKCCVCVSLSLRVCVGVCAPVCVCVWEPDSVRV